MITKDKHFYKMILSITIPVACQNLITFAVSMADSVMIGRVGEIPLTAVSLANQLFFVFMIFIFGLGSGGNILIAQYWGKEGTESIRKVISIMYKVAIAFTVCFMSVAGFFSEWFMRCFSQEGLVIELGSQYLKIIFISYIFFAVTNVTINALRSVHTVKISVIVYSVSLVVNIFLNWVLIFGNLGFEALGVRGAAIATTIARLFEFVIALSFFLFADKKIQFKLKYLLKTDRILLKDFAIVGGPVVFNELVWALGSTALALIVSKMGTQAVAATSINNVVWQFVAIFIMGAGQAGAVIIGNTVGQTQYDKVQEYAHTLIAGAVLLGIFGGMVMFMIRPYVLMLYKISDVTKDIAMQIMGVSSGILLFQSLAFILMIGILRGGGDTKFVLITDIVSLWLVAVPLGYIAAVVWKLPIPLVYVFLKCDEVIKVIVTFFRVKRGKWINNVTR